MIPVVIKKIPIIMLNSKNKKEISGLNFEKNPQS